MGQNMSLFIQSLPEASCACPLRRAKTAICHLSSSTSSLKAGRNLSPFRCLRWQGTSRFENGPYCVTFRSLDQFAIALKVARDCAWPGHQLYKAVRATIHRAYAFAGHPLLWIAPYRVVGETSDAVPAWSSAVPAGSRRAVLLACVGMHSQSAAVARAINHMAMVQSGLRGM